PERDEAFTPVVLTRLDRGAFVFCCITLRHEILASIHAAINVPIMNESNRLSARNKNDLGSCRRKALIVVVPPYGVVGETDGLTDGLTGVLAEALGETLGLTLADAVGWVDGVTIVVLLLS